VGLRLRRPTDQQLAALLERCQSDDLTYASVGISLDGESTPAGFHRRRWTTTLRGPEAFDRGTDAIRSWAVHRGAGLLVATDGPIAVGTNVALSAPLPVGFASATCRIVVVIDEPDRYGFAYGTLSVHPESGEEAFIVARDDDGRTRFDVEAVARPQDPLARLAPPIANRLQDRTARRYLSAMERAVAPTA
jgi:uncharacterized protein (UPF0548 family)